MASAFAELGLIHGLNPGSGCADRSAAEEVLAPPVLPTPDVGVEPTLEVGPLLELVVPDVEFELKFGFRTIPTRSKRSSNGFRSRVGPELVVPDVVSVVPAVVLGPVVVLVRDDEVLSDAPGAALPGAATARAVPPIAASPNVNRAAVLAMRVLIIDVPFLEA
ncbi:hypothetical protein [Mycolicibacterium moriokaense]|uniref:Uncharacterized protein n=1 Tax=Mycolicibacterium moriokaense TaxID=39691 RepID=A0A318HNC4_9MYCO|nr:hypothetical protein [Mycolicibacterium moriokaense]PXX12943.1 hypothetical protein C8E89_10191 [Mycolicibacterium moriokaense]